MNEQKLLELFELLGEEGSGIDSPETLASIIENEGVGVFFPNVPEGSFADQDEFVDYFKDLKKKDLSALSSTESVSGQDQLGTFLDSEVTDPVGVRYGANVQAPEKNTWLEEQLGKNVVTDFFGDIWRAGAQGMKQGATIDDARRLFIQGSSTSEEDVDEYIRAVGQMDDVGMSDEMRSFNNIYEANGGGVLGFVLGVAQNPSVIAQLFISSVASMVNPDVVGIGVAAGAAGALAGGAAGGSAGSVVPGAGTAAGALAGSITGGIRGAIFGASAALETGLGFTEFMKEEVEKKGLPFDADGIREVLNDSDALQAIRNKAAARGMVIGTVDAFAYGLASKIGGGPIKAARAAGKTVTKGMKGRAALKAAGIEAAGGAGGEALARAVTGQEMDVAEIGFEGITGQASSVLSVPQAVTGKSLTEIAGLTVGKGINIFKPPKYGILTKDGKNQPQTRAQIEKMIETMTDQEIIDTQFDIKNDADLQAQIDERKQKAQFDKTTPEYITGVDRKVLMDLQREKSNMTDPDTPENKKRISEIDNKIQEILDKYEGAETAKVEFEVDGKPISRYFAITMAEARAALEKEGVTKPSDKQIKAKQKELLKLAIEAAKAAAKVGDRVKSAKDLIEDEEQQKKLAIDELASEGIVNPTEQQIKDKIDASKKSSAVEEVSQDQTRGTEGVAEGLPSKLQPTPKKGDTKTKGEDAAQAQAEIDSPLTPENLAENETIVETETDSKGRKITRLKQVSEKDGVTTTDYVFNRDDKAADQRSTGVVSEEVALKDTNLEISPDEKAEAEANLEKGQTVEYRISQKREGKTGASATVSLLIKDKNGKIVRQLSQEMGLVEKTKAAPPSKPSKPFKNVLAPIEKPHIVPGDKGRRGRTEIKLTEDGKVKNIVKRGTKNTPASKMQQNKAADFYLESMADVNAGERADIDAGVTNPNEINEIVAETSNNIREVAEAIDSQEKAIAAESDARGEVANEAGVGALANPDGTPNVRFTPESFMRVVGRSWKEMGVSRIWIASKEKGGVSIEDGAFTEGIVDPNVADTNDVVEFVTSFRDKAAIKEHLGATVDSTNILETLKEKFKALTGLEATARNIRTVLKIDPKRPPNEYYAEMGLEMDREAAGKPGVFSKKKRGPSAKKIIGAPKDKKVTVNERIALKDQIKSQVKAARQSAKAYKKALQNIAAKVRSLTKGKIINSIQAKAIITRLSNVNVNNKLSVKRFLEYVDRVFTKAEYVETIKKAKGLAKRAKKQVGGRKTGLIPNASKVILENLFSVNPYAIPDKFMDAYLNILEVFGTPKPQIKLTEKIEESIAKAEEILNEVYKEADENSVEVVKDVKPKEYNLTNAIKEIKAETIRESEINQFPLQVQRDKARAIQKLTTQDIKNLVREKKDGTKDYSLIEKLRIAKQNLINGLLTKDVVDVLTQVESTQKEAKINKPIAKSKEASIWNHLANYATTIKAAISAKTNFLVDKLEGNALFFMDDVLGNFNSKAIFENTVGIINTAYSTFITEAKKLKTQISEAEAYLEGDVSKLRKKLGITAARNKIVEQKNMIALYQFGREHESNKDRNGKPNPKAPPAAEILDKTINNPKVLNPFSKKILRNLREKYVVDGVLDMKKLKNDFTPAMNKALDLYDKVNNSLAEKALYISSTLHGNKIDLLNNWVHHSILDVDAKESNLLKSQERFVSTKAGTTFNRTPGAKATSFDPSYAATRGVQETLLDFHMTQAVRTVRQTVSKLIKNMEKTNNQAAVDAANAIDIVIDNRLRQVFQKSFSDMTVLDRIGGAVAKLGYYQSLASAPRMMSEMLSNMWMMVKNPKIAAYSFANYTGLSLTDPDRVQNGIAILTALESSETQKQYNIDDIGGKMADLNEFIRPDQSSGEAVSVVAEKMAQILKLGLKQTASAVDKISARLLSYGDQAISRPLWFGTFNDAFKKAVKKYNKESISDLTPAEFKKIGDGTSKYMDAKYAQARKAATAAADRNAITVATSTNPFSGIGKHIIVPRDSVMRRVYKQANRFMIRFQMFEFGTARHAINAMFVTGEISRIQAAGLLAGVTMRMATYMVAYTALTQLLDEELFGIEDEDREEDFASLLARQMIGSMASLGLRRNLGNLPAIPINFMLEHGLNEPLLEGLRGGEEYNPYKHAMIFNQLGKQDLQKDFGMNLDTMIKLFAGPYGPLAKTMTRLGKVGSRAAFNKTKESRQKNIDELTDRMSIEVMGNLGLLPFYKDIRRMLMKEMYGKKDYKPTERDPNPEWDKFKSDDPDFNNDGWYNEEDSWETFEEKGKETGADWSDFDPNK